MEKISFEKFKVKSWLRENENIKVYLLEKYLSRISFETIEGLRHPTHTAIGFDISTDFFVIEFNAENFNSDCIVPTIQNGKLYWKNRGIYNFIPNSSLDYWDTQRMIGTISGNTLEKLCNHLQKEYIPNNREYHLIGLCDKYQSKICDDYCIYIIKYLNIDKVMGDIYKNNISIIPTKDSRITEMKISRNLKTINEYYEKVIKLRKLLYLLLREGDINILQDIVDIAKPTREKMEKLEKYMDIYFTVKDGTIMDTHDLEILIIYILYDIISGPQVYYTPENKYLYIENTDGLKVYQTPIILYTENFELDTDDYRKHFIAIFIFLVIAIIAGIFICRKLNNKDFHDNK